MQLNVINNVYINKVHLGICPPLDTSQFHNEGQGQCQLHTVDLETIQTPFAHII